MALRELGYQKKVLDRLTDYVGELAIQKRKADKIAAANALETDPDLIIPVPDFPMKAWDAMRAANKLPMSRAGISFSPRQDGMGRFAQDFQGPGRCDRLFPTRG